MTDFRHQNSLHQSDRMHYDDVPHHTERNDGLGEETTPQDAVELTELDPNSHTSQASSIPSQRNNDAVDLEQGEDASITQPKISREINSSEEDATSVHKPTRLNRYDRLMQKMNSFWLLEFLSWTLSASYFL